MAKYANPTGIKVALIGDSGVGKSTILSILLGESFNTCYVKTKERVVQVKDIPLSNGRKQRLQIWDTPGDDDSRTYTTHSLRDIKGVIIVFDVCKECSFLNVQNWIKVLYDYVDNARESVVVIIAANKIDKLSKRTIQPEQIEQLAHQFNTQYIEVSAKQEERIKELFHMLASGLADKANYQEGFSQSNEASEDLEASTQSKKKGVLSTCTVL